MRETPGVMAQQEQAQRIGQQAVMSGQQSESMGLKPVTVTDIIQTDVVTAELDSPIPDIATRMEEEEVGSVIVLDGEKPVGIVTDRAIALFCQEMEAPQEYTAEDVLSEKLISGDREMTISDVLEKMSEEKIRRFPVLDEDGSLEGIVTLDDLLVLLGSEMQKSTDVIQGQSSRL